MTFAFKKATREAVKLKLAIAGPSGSGKTLGALSLAKGLAGAGRIALIDTENGSASLYGDRYEFDVLNLAPPFTSKRYEQALSAAVEAGYDVIVIDSLSHQWNGEGGILARKEEMDKRPGSNSYTNWATFTKEHTAFLSTILHLPAHVIATLRSKQDYVLETNEKGKQQPKKIGMAPVQREGLEYEFSAVFDVQMDHRATASKDRTGLFEGELVDLLDAKVAKRLVAWLASGAPVATPAKITPEQEARLRFLMTGLDEVAAEKIERKLAKGMTAHTAEEAIAWVESLGVESYAKRAAARESEAAAPEPELALGATTKQHSTRITD